MDITFNTGRLYARDGQIIRAVWSKDTNEVHFRDFSRMIMGTVEAPHSDTKTPHALAAHLMAHYDRHEYRITLESMQLGRDPDAKVHSFRI